MDWHQVDWAQVPEDEVYWLVALILQLGFLLRLLKFLWDSDLRPFQWLHGLRRTKYQVDPQVVKDLDLLRCRITCRIWNMLAAGSMARVVVQLGVLGTERKLPDLDSVTLFGLGMGLLVLWMPGLIRPQTLDVWYVSTSLIATGLLMFVSDTDARDVLNLTFGLRIFLGMLAKYNLSWIFCTAAAAAQIFWTAHSQGTVLMSGLPIPALYVAVGNPCIIILVLRWVLYEYSIVKTGLHKKTMELGAVSSLLLVSYDAVVQVDQDLNFTEGSEDHGQHLKGLLLRTQDGGCAAGKSFLQLFDEADRDRLADHFAESVSDDAPIRATNADMLDSDRNHIKVEILHAQFRDHCNARCFLIGVRETQSSESPGPLFRDIRYASPTPTRHKLHKLHKLQDLYVIFQVPSFQVLQLSEDLQRLCQRATSKTPETILDFSSDQSRDTFNSKLQNLVNEIVAQQSSKAEDPSDGPRSCGDEWAAQSLKSDDSSDGAQLDGHGATLSFNLLGLYEVQASINMKEASGAFVGSLQVLHAIEVQEGPTASADADSIEDPSLSAALVQVTEVPRGRPYPWYCVVSKSSDTASVAPVVYGSDDFDGVRL